MAKKQSSNARKSRKRARKRALTKQTSSSKDEGSLLKSENLLEADQNNKKGDDDLLMKKKKRKIQENNREDDGDEEEEDDLLAIAAAWASDHSTKNKKTDHETAAATTATSKQRKPQKNKSLKSVDRKPPPFPKHQQQPLLRLPKTGFLKNEEPYCKSFETALNTAYEGVVWDGPTATLPETDIRNALSVMDESGLFRTDVTQPAGLGTKLVLGYVTRCLLGEEGTTYRYLGLRMFSHPWNGSGQNGKGKNGKHNNKKLKHAIQTMQTLNERLMERTQIHLKQLESKRRKRNEKEPTVQGKSNYDVTLINKMTVHKKLRDEPMFGDNKYSVGWHADSSLEHFSAIAVYHTIMNPSPTTNNNEGNWSVALRVTHDAEGPRGKRLGDITVEEHSPPIQVELPSGSTYYLLDDFNHHHQHAVLAPPPNHHQSAKSVRFSSTHRLLRKGHNVKDIIERCKTVCDNFQRHGSKRWRSEQLLLTELENEWLRQFFIQGPFHKKIHWGYWQEPIRELFQYWEKLEARTKQIILILKHASEERCGKHTSRHGKEALATIEQVKGDRNPKDVLYDSMASLLSQRAKSRDLWAKRERDPVFKRLHEDCQPIPFPVAFKSNQSSAETVMATSALPDGSSAFLTELTSHVKALGVAYESGSAKSLPEKDIIKDDN